MRLITIALFATSYLTVASAAAAPPTVVVVPHGLAAALSNTVSQSAAAANAASNASANGAAHAAANSAAAASNAVAASTGANTAANAASSAAAASNASANGAAHAAANSAAAATVASNAAAASDAASSAANSAAAAVNAANSASNASANAAAHAAANSAAAAAVASNAAAASVGANAAGSAANSAATAANAATIASNASANGAAHAAANSAAAATVASNAAADGGAGTAGAAEGIASLASARNGQRSTTPPGLADKGGAPPGQAKQAGDSTPPGLADKGGSPPGRTKQAGDSTPPGLADKGGAPPGQAKQDGDGMAPGLADKGGAPPGLAQSDGVPPGQIGGSPSGLAQNVGSPAGLTGSSGAPPAVIQIGGSAPMGEYQSSNPAIMVLNGGPSGNGDGRPQDLPQTAQNTPGAGGPDQPDKTEALARNSQSEPEQQQKVAAAISAGLLEYSRSGIIVRKGEILALSPSPASLTKARSLGYAMVERLPLKGLGLDAVVLRAPANLTTDQALGRLQTADPRGGYSLNPIYATTGEVGPAARSVVAPMRQTTHPSGATVGLIDTGVFLQHPALAQVRLEQQGFAPGGLNPGKHGTAVASIAAGLAGEFHGVAPGSRIYVADVYGKSGAGGAASSVAEGIDWLVRKGVPVINVSLVGPPNKLMQAAIDAAIRKGVIVVAAVGNDGPNSPPLFPAAYGGVLAVTGVDQNNHILFEAVRATRVAFAAPGADIFAADGAAGFAKVRGTSFAAPIVAGQLALAHRRLNGKDAAAAIRGLKQTAKAPAAADAAFGFGIVGEDARLALRPGMSQITTAGAESSERSKE